MINDSINQRLMEVRERINTKQAMPYTGELYTGVDLGTANIVLTVVDEKGNIIAAGSQNAKVVRDGIIYDYIGAVACVRALKKELESIIGRPLIKAATAYPPGVAEGAVKTIMNVVEACDFELVKIVDEPSAAAIVLEIDSGAVVDVGGGTTGISIIEKGKVCFTADEATGGHHMSLVVAGNLNISYDEAEQVKMSPETDAFPMIRPVIEKMGTIVNQSIKGYSVSSIYVVGGACSFKQFEEVFYKITGIKTYKTVEPLLVTPLGIALSCIEGEMPCMKH
ncbi:ethanolamine utilization protein EutJ [Fusibacter ferrireducens]|uniref:Chaperone protein DnaK n=1 Tax=Fusibacter ferrireducens TaxID=2785058 RepID=A0ABS0A1C0_9FIRM|nr:ethanolamine utilization protein EutJ [Fusibacter ferrireducens]MBF4695925.1 ethanolamine utilization protein EutJ [Fusibacter ferrireducens]